MKHSSTFDSEYFTEYYQPMTGNFTPEDLQRNINWFYGWFNVLKDWYDFGKGSNRKVLEIGCAIGAASRILAERGFSVTATDISSYAIEHAKKVNVHKNLHFEKLNIEVPNKNKIAYDLIFGFEVIEHVELLDASFKNMHELLTDDGVLILSTPYPTAHVFIDKTHINVRHPMDWMRRLENAGFRNIRTKRATFLPFMYRLSKDLHITVPIGINWKYLNSPVFLYAQKVS